MTTVHTIAGEITDVRDDGQMKTGTLRGIPVILSAKPSAMQRVIDARIESDIEATRERRRAYLDRHMHRLMKICRCTAHAWTHAHTEYAGCPPKLHYGDAVYLLDRIRQASRRAADIAQAKRASWRNG